MHTLPPPTRCETIVVTIKKIVAVGDSCSLHVGITQIKAWGFWGFIILCVEAEINGFELGGGESGSACTVLEKTKNKESDCAQVDIFFAWVDRAEGGGRPVSRCPLYNFQNSLLL